MIGIYKITNNITNKVYIGQSIKINTRWAAYKRLDCKYQHLIYRSLKKYGIENHSFEVIESFESISRTDLDLKEIYYIKEYKNNNIKLLNLNDGGLGNRGYKVSEEYKQRLKIETALRFTGRKHTPEDLKKISEGRKGKLLKGDNHLSKTILNTETGIYYTSLIEASEAYNLNYGYLTKRLNGNKRNNSQFINI